MSFDGNQMSEGNGQTMRGGAETIYQVVQAWAQHTPEAVALLSPCYPAITYGQLLSQIDSIVKSLREVGITHSDRIALVLPNSIELAAVFLGVSCAAISVPLNPSYGENEIERYMTDLCAQALVAPADADSPARSVARRHGLPVLELVPDYGSGRFAFNRSAPLSSAPEHTVKPADVALILHTSGTTAKSKRVPLTHRNLCASARAIGDTLQLTSRDRCLGVMPLFHIHGLIGGLLSSIAAGASFAATAAFDPSCFFEWMEDLDPTWYTAVPTIHQAILGCARDRGETTRMGRLRFIRSCSAPLPRNVMAKLEEVFKAPVIEAYGMTEAAHQITTNPLPPAERKAGSVGMATRTEVAIMDETGHLLEAGERGEVVIRGANVTSGYEPAVANTGSFTGGWFRTGDLGYLDSAGYLFLTGRAKEIINRGGEKISPAAIDAALLDHPEVLQAAAFGVPHPSLGEDVAAAVVVRDRHQISEASLRHYLSERLAPFELPSHLLIVDEIPKSSTGKIPRAALAETFAGLLQSSFVAPRNDLEALVAEIYADVLETPHVGAADNFFALGGDSLRATQVISRVRSLFAVDLPITTLFSKGTVAELAQEIAASVESLDDNAKDAICKQLREV